MVNSVGFWVYVPYLNKIVYKLNKHFYAKPTWIHLDPMQIALTFNPQSPCQLKFSLQSDKSCLFDLHH